MIPHGVRLEQNKSAFLKQGIRSVPEPADAPAPPSFAPLRGEAGGGRILTAAKKAGIDDETDGAPLEKKLAELAERRTALLVACCFDDDPYAASEQAVLREDAEKVAAGLALAAKACRAGETLIAVASKGEARRLAAQGVGVPAAAVGKRYPAGFLLMKKLRRGGKTAAFVGAQACAALADAVRDGRPQSETVVTVAGDGAGACGNYRVRIGMPVEAVLKAAGADGRAEFAAVGPAMTGRSVRDLTMPVTAAARCVVVMKKAPVQRTFPCVRCGRCARACPVGVVPWLVHRELEGGSPDPLLLFHVGECLGCRGCAAVCPSGIELAAEVKRAAALKEGGRAG